MRITNVYVPIAIGITNLYVLSSRACPRDLIPNTVYCFHTKLRCFGLAKHEILTLRLSAFAAKTNFELETLNFELETFQLSNFSIFQLSKKNLPAKSIMI
jgi:hypothetical protein